MNRSIANHDAGSKMLPYEDIKEKTTYALTWNPVWEEDRRQLSVSKIDQFKCYLIAHFSKLKYSLIKVNIEFSPTGRLHIHGTITIVDKLMFYQEDLPLFTEYNTCMKTLDDNKTDKEKKYKDWNEYISKQNLPSRYTSIMLPYIPQLKETQKAKPTVLEKIIVKQSPRKRAQSRKKSHN